ncbi:MAG: hypothetical protein ACE361_22070 [Aureliella sp.]
MNFRFTRLLSIAVGVAIPAIANAQFERIDGIVRNIETQFQQSYEIPASPGVPVANPSLIIEGIIRPLEWELAKLEIQLEILGDESSSLEVQVQRSEHLLQDYSNQLLALGVTNRSAIDKKTDLIAALEQQMRMLEAESQALKASMEKSRSSKLKKLMVEEAAVKLDTQKAALSALREKYAITKRLIDQGAISSTEALTLEASMKQQEGALQLAQLELEKAVAETDAAALNELTKATEAKEATQRQLVELREELNKMSEGLRMLDEKELQRSRLTFSDRQMSQMASSKSTLGMEYAYLKKIIDSYRAPLKKKQGEE